MRKLLCCVMGIVLLILPVVGCKKESDDGFLRATVDGKYSSFEEMLLAEDDITDIVRAKCLKIEEENEEETIYRFEVTKRYLGDETQRILFVDISKGVSISAAKYPDQEGEPRGVTYQSDDISYLPEEEYFLFLHRKVSVFQERDDYSLGAGSPHFPASNLSAATMYNQPLSEHSEIPSYATEEELMGYVNEVLSTVNLEARPKYHGTLPIESKKMKTIVQQSPYVLKVRVDSVYDNEVGYDDEFATCTVIAAMKGEAEEQTTVEIQVQKGEVKEGKTYIVAVNRVEEDRYQISSKNSVWGA